MNKEILILDESLNALDVDSRIAILCDLLTLDKTILYVTHEHEELSSLAFDSRITV